MKQSPRPARTPSTLSDSLHHQLSLYALAASAAGVSLLALPLPSEGKVVYTPAHKWLPVNQYYYLDLNHDGVNDFQFILGSTIFSASFVRHMSLRWAASTQTKNAIYSIKSKGFSCAAALPKGTKVGPHSPGFKSQVRAAFMFSSAFSAFNSNRTYFGPWMNVTKSAYLGVQFGIKGEVHYGWARFGRIRHDKPVRALLMGYAYETTPNKRIVTGETKGPDVITAQPDAEPGSLGRLALGRKK